MRRAHPVPVRVGRSVALAAAAVALALALRSSPPLALVLGAGALGALLAPLLEWTSIPAPLVRVLPRVSGLVLVAAALVGWSSRSLGILLLEPTLLPSVAGPFAVGASLAFALAPRAFAPGTTLVPATLAVLVLAGLNPTPAGYGRSVLPFLGADHNGFAEVYLGLAVVVLSALWAATLLEAGPRWRRRDALAVGVAAVVALALAAAGIAGLPLLQPRVEKAFAQALASGSTGLSGESTLGEYAELAVSRRRVLDLEASRPGGAWLLRSEVFTTFDGRRWTNPSARRRPSLLRPTAPPPGRGPLLEDTGAWFPTGPEGPVDPERAIELRVVQADVGRWPLLLPRGPAAVSADVPYLEVDRFGSLRRPGGLPITLYGARLAPGTRPAPAPLDEGERGESLALPADVHPEVRALAASLAPADASAGERLRRTVDHLHNGYTYTLKPGAFRSPDPVAEFLLEKKAGYCEYFASAAAVLLRLQGVPARFVKGLSAGPQTDLGGGLHVVRESDAHAWVEAWLPGEGWVEADPTPPAQFASAHAPPGPLERLVQRARAALATAWARLTVRGPLGLLRQWARALAGTARRAAAEPLAWAALAALLLGPRLLRAWRSRRKGPGRLDEGATSDVPLELLRLVRDLERRWRAAGHARPPARGLREHASRLARSAPVAPPVPLALVEAGHRVVDAYYAARYGGRPTDPAEVERLREALRA